MIIECKEMNVNMDEAVIRQALNYNITLQTDYLVITNGTAIHGFDLRTTPPVQLSEFPAY
jgi:predicted type IV restriction endonuclease